MNFKTIQRDVCGKTEWVWPAGDDKMIIVFDHLELIDKMLSYVKNRGVCVQAGGAAGVFAYRLAHEFEIVHTIEPEPTNYDCLFKNCLKKKNIFMYYSALSNRKRNIRVSEDIHARHNFGAGHIIPDENGIETMVIDELDLEECDLILLDIEGAELEALQGAKETIKRFHPTIVIEDKPMPHMAVFGTQVGDPAKWLARFGYDPVDRLHWDTVFVSQEAIIC